ncbi:bacteriocin [Candidatus Poribacteria bacterium]|nr:bacteriocin [Candidatus Poribacteria bacterium]
MADYLNREEAPLSHEDWERLDKIVVEVARKRLVGRRFITIRGPLGVGIQVIQKSSLSGMAGGEEIAVSQRENLAIPMIAKDFRLHWRDIESSQRLGMPLELGPAAAASAVCAQMEDRLIFTGCAHEGEACACPGLGLLNVNGRNELETAGWEKPGRAFQDAVAAIEKLISAGCYEPYGMVVSPAMYAKLHRMMGRGARLEIAFIKELMTDGIYQSPVLKANEGVVVATSLENLDLVIGQDLITAYLGLDNMDHPFRIFETVLLRIRRPEAICTFCVKTG